MRTRNVVITEMMILLALVFTVTTQMASGNFAIQNGESEYINVEAHAVIETSDGGYLVVGSLKFGDPYQSDVWLVKTDNNGNELWNQTFGGTGWDEARSVIETADGGFLLAGRTDSFGAGDADMWLIKTASNSYEQWSQTFGGPEQDAGRSVIETADSGFLIAGVTYSFGASVSSIWLVKTDSNGDEQWNQTFRAGDWDGIYSLIETADGGFLLAGINYSFGDRYTGDMWLIKTDSNGDEQWNRTFGGTGDDSANSVIETADSGFLLAGRTDSFGAGGADMWLIKTDSNGDEQWNQSFGGLGNDWAKSAIKTADGGFLLVGVSYNYDAVITLSTILLIKTDSNGNELWNQTFTRTTIDSSRQENENLPNNVVFVFGLFVILGIVGLSLQIRSKKEQ
jgi:hypothetical protein